MERVPPADVHRALRRLLAGQEAAGGKLLPPLLARAPECLRRTRHVAALYASLARSSGAGASLRRLRAPGQYPSNPYDFYK